MTIYFTADTHFWHKNVLNFEDRPYSTVEEMTNAMIYTWNEQVTDEDTVYHLGDLCLGNLEQTVDVLERLKGKIILIKGNHDASRHYKKIMEMGLLEEYHEVGISFKKNKHQLWLTHYPLEIGVRPNKWSIHGHIHSEESTYANQINVGVDSPHFKYKKFGELISLEEVFELIERTVPIIEREYTRA